MSENLVSLQRRGPWWYRHWWVLASHRVSKFGVADSAKQFQDICCQLWRCLCMCCLILWFGRIGRGDDNTELDHLQQVIHSSRLFQDHGSAARKYFWGLILKLVHPPDKLLYVTFHTSNIIKFVSLMALYRENTNEPFSPWLNINSRLGLFFLGISWRNGQEKCTGGLNWGETKVSSVNKVSCFYKPNGFKNDITCSLLK